MTGPQLVIFGCLTTDNVVTSEGEFLPQTFGGNCLYAALGARVWSNSVGVVSRYGAGYSEAPLDLLRGLGVDTSGVRNLGVPHGRNVAFAYRADGSRTRAFPPDLIARIPVEERGRFIDSSLLPDADERWRQFAPDGEDAPPEWWDGVVGVHCAYLPVSNHMRIAQMVRRKGARPIWLQVDSPWHDPRRPEVDHAGPLFRQIDALLPSEADIEAFRPGAPAAQTTLALLDAGARTVVLKLGASGCQVFEAGVGLLAKFQPWPWRHAIRPARATRFAAVFSPECKFRTTRRPRRDTAPFPLPSRSRRPAWRASWQVRARRRRIDCDRS